jgi:aldehyde dehydrogenase (NAD+)
VQLLGIQLVHALVAGNEVIVKPSEHSPRTQVRLLELAVEAGLPPGALRWTEATRAAGQRLLDDNHLDHVVFTGSTAVGRAIATVLGDRLVSSCLELSGRDSAIVLADADADHAARTLWRSVRKNAGQTCMAPRRALVEPGAYAAFVAAIDRCAADNPPVRLISAAPADAVRTQLRDAVRAGGRAIPTDFDSPDPRSMPAVFVADCPEDAALVAGDHFGPALAIVPVRDLDHALAIHHRIGQHLATSIFTRDPRRAAALAPRLNSSHVTINESVMPTAHPAACLGGHGASGWGVSRGREGLLAMTRTVTVSRPSGPVRLPSDAPDAKTLDGLRRFIGFRYGGPGWRRLAPASESPRPANPTPHRESTPVPATPVASTRPH